MEIDNQTTVITNVIQMFFVALFDAKGYKIPSSDLEWAKELLHYLVFGIIDFVNDNDNVDMIFVKCMNYIQNVSSCSMDKDAMQEIYENFSGVKIYYDVTRLQSLKDFDLEYFKKNIINNVPDNSISTFNSYEKLLFNGYLRMKILSMKQNKHVISNEDINSLKQQTIKQFECIINDSKRAGTYELPHNLGSIILGYESSDKKAVVDFVHKYRTYMLDLIIEGVTSRDIYNWWNQPDVSRRLVYFDDAAFALTFFLSIQGNDIENKQENTNDDQFKKNLSQYRRNNPSFKAFEYADSSIKDLDFLNVDDLPLPYELKERVLTFHEKRRLGGGLRDEEFINFTSYNAFIRSKIRDGDI